ncbi:MAG TPA: DUF5916 domain-containing protein, partial [Bacteroidia bacterium]|nr:DUF5916 domain-containing protein [Bacteroidia bacterium]
DCDDLLDTNEVLSKNPSRARLLNATKVSGRTNLGMGLGILNAFVDNTYAIAQDTATGKMRKILTEPRSNYNIFVIDRQMENSSSVYFINTNVIRTGGYRSSNVTGLGMTLNNKKMSWQIDAHGAVSNVMYPDTTDQSEFTADIGYKYYLAINKTSGTWQGGIVRNVLSRLWDADDLGLTFDNNFAANRVWGMYQLFNPKWIFNYASSDLSFNYNYNLKSGKSTYMGFNNFNYVQFRNFWSIYVGTEWVPKDFLDYFEPRVTGRVFTRPRMWHAFAGINSNASEKLSFGMEIYTGRTAIISPTIPANPWVGGGVSVKWRATDRLQLIVFGNRHTDFGDRGWVNTEDDGTIVFGRRNIRDLELGASMQYVFMKDMNISLSGRHYWATGNYTGYYVLREDGALNDYVTYDSIHDFSFNSINLDVVYSWIFAPGSIVSVAYKLNTLAEENVINYEYKYNFKNTMQSPQLNQLSVRVLYYLDYQYITSALKKSRSKSS